MILYRRNGPHDRGCCWRRDINQVSVRWNVSYYTGMRGTEPKYLRLGSRLALMRRHQGTRAGRVFYSMIARPLHMQQQEPFPILGWQKEAAVHTCILRHSKSVDVVETSEELVHHGVDPQTTADKSSNTNLAQASEGTLRTLPM